MLEPYQISWQMFTLTGNPAYYLLYKNLEDWEEDELSKEERLRR